MTAEQHAEKLMYKLSVRSMYDWKPIIIESIEEAIAEEREACALIADYETATADMMIPMCGQYKARVIAANIKARGNK